MILLPKTKIEIIQVVIKYLAQIGVDFAMHAGLTSKKKETKFEVEARANIRPCFVPVRGELIWREDPEEFAKKISLGKDVEWIDVTFCDKKVPETVKLGFEFKYEDLNVSVTFTNDFTRFRFSL